MLPAIFQELKGNIRVFCRVRPELAGDGPSGATPEPLMQFPSSGTAGSHICPAPHNAQEFMPAPCHKVGTTDALSSSAAVYVMQARKPVNARDVTAAARHICYNVALQC